MIKAVDSLSPLETQVLIEEWVQARIANPEQAPGDNLAFLKSLQSLKQHWLEQQSAQIIKP